MGRGRPGFPRDFSCRVVLELRQQGQTNQRLRDCHPLWCGVPATSGSLVAPVTRCQPDRCRLATLHTQRLTALARAQFRQIPFRSPLLRDLFRFLGVLRCFSSPTYLPHRGGSGRITARGLPHSDWTGSRPDCGSPVVSLLVCVLRRLGVPRHPPTAHHVLPGHGALGGHGQRPRQLCNDQ